MVRNNVLLFHPRTGHERNYRNFWIPYSILSVGSELKRKGYDIRLLDNNLESIDVKMFKEILASYNQDNLAFVGISSMIGHQISEGLLFARSVRDLMPSIPIVWGGAAPTILSEEFVTSPLVDVVVRGQGEETSTEIAHALSKDRELEKVFGIWFKQAQKVIKNQDKNPLHKNSFASYNYSLVQTQAYIKEDEHINSRVLNHVSSLGCPFSCGFCSEVALHNKRWIPETSERMVGEVGELIERYDANGIKFYDANFFVNKERVLSFSREVLRRNWNIKWAGSAHPNNLAIFNDKELEEIMKSGCSRILIGAESGNDEELRYIKKNMTTEDVLNIAKRLGNIGIRGSFTIIVGYPGFPKENIEQTLDFGKKITSVSPLHEVKAHIYTPYPGTPLYNEAVKYGFVPPKSLDGWISYDYYEIQTPWLREGLNDEVRKFNKEFCLYVL